jgi:hypothetical protein
MRRLLCLVGLHDFAFVERLSDVAMRVRCRRCARHFAVNMEMRAIVRWDSDAEELYASLRRSRARA